MKNKKQQYAVFGGLFSAIAFVLYLIEFPVIPSLSYLKLDLSDIPALLGAAIFGPLFGVIVELVKNLLELLVRGFGSQMGFGNIMNFLVGCAYVVPFSLVWRKGAGTGKNIKIAVVSMLVGLVSIVVLGALGNYFIAPLFFKYFLGIELTADALKTAVFGATAINTIKGAMLSVVSYPMLRTLGGRLKKILKDR